MDYLAAERVCVESQKVTGHVVGGRGALPFPLPRTTIHPRTLGMWPQGESFFLDSPSPLGGGLLRWQREISKETGQSHGFCHPPGLHMEPGPHGDEVPSPAYHPDLGQ